MIGVVFNTDTGVVISMIESDDIGHFPLQCRSGQDWILADGDDTDENTFVDVTTIPHSKHRKMDYTIEALPIPCTATIEGIEYQITEQPTFEFPALPVAMSYTVSIDAGVQYLKKEFVINVDPT